MLVAVFIFFLLPLHLKAAHDTTSQGDINDVNRQRDAVTAFIHLENGQVVTFVLLLLSSLLALFCCCCCCC